MVRIIEIMLFTSITKYRNYIACHHDSKHVKHVIYIIYTLKIFVTTWSKKCRHSIFVNMY